MLRIGYLPSDFNPMVLLLGEAEDFRALAGVLRQFARRPAPVRLDALACAAPETAAVLLAPATDSAGLLAGEPPLRWHLAPGHATRFAAQLDELAQPAVLAGSELLTCGLTEEITVKASRGEYTDDFLLPPRVA